MTFCRDFRLIAVHKKTNNSNITLSDNACVGQNISSVSEKALMIDGATKQNLVPIVKI
jgi:hypothetical protein